VNPLIPNSAITQWPEILCQLQRWMGKQRMLLMLWAQLGATMAFKFQKWPFEPKKRCWAGKTK